MIGWSMNIDTMSCSISEASACTIAPGEKACVEKNLVVFNVCFLTGTLARVDLKSITWEHHQYSFRNVSCECFLSLRQMVCYCIFKKNWEAHCSYFPEFQQWMTLWSPACVLLLSAQSAWFEPHECSFASSINTNGRETHHCNPDAA